ncbi:MAG TPA: helix-turn-helix domain-containing protein [Thermoflexia bacterium]|nr:helix-turn-helix domain-containing protein [Thermoflexia bacterium]
MYHQITLVTWAFAPEWLTVEEASRLSGYSVNTIAWLAREGAIDIADGTELLIEKESLREFQESLLEIA